MNIEELQALWKRSGCRACVHFRPSSCSCVAFPGGIPIQVASTQLDHFGPIQGDHGIRFEPIPGAASSATVGRVEFSGSSIGTFAAGLARRLDAKFGITYQDKS